MKKLGQWYSIKTLINREVFTLRLILIWGVGILLLHFSPFNLSARLYEETQNLVLAIFSPSFPPDGRSALAEPAVVVEITNDSLRAFRIEQCKEIDRRLKDLNRASSFDLKACEIECIVKKDGGNTTGCDVADYLTEEERRVWQNGSILLYPVEDPTDVWPISYGIHDYLISRLIELEPAAIMVDITFGPPRRWDNELKTFGKRIEAAQKQLVEFGEKPVPVYFAIDENSLYQGMTSLDTLKRNAQNSEDYVFDVPTTWKEDDNWYPIKITEFPTVYSPAAKIFLDLCLEQRGNDGNLPRACGSMRKLEVCETNTPEGLGNDGISGDPSLDCLPLGKTEIDTSEDFIFTISSPKMDLEKFHDRMLVRWPYNISELQPNFKNQDLCAQKVPPSSLRFFGIDWGPVIPDLGVIWQLVSQSTGIMWQGGPIQPCRPMPTVGAARLLPEYDKGLGELYSLVNNRVVFLGAYIREYPDTIDTTLYDKVPGVAFHATAYRNLTAYGTDYFRSNPFLKSVIEAVLWFFIAVHSAVKIGLHEAHLNGAMSVRSYERSRIWLNRAIMGINFLGFCIACLLWLMHTAPVDFLSLAALSGGLALVETIVLAKPMLSIGGIMISLVSYTMMATRCCAVLVKQVDRRVISILAWGWRYLVANVHRAISHFFKKK
ncbi:MAG: CHASE2 domain-containing protein [Alphaproteobacteria bacterium]|nr:CHASE2 domain-containing protein [Alphaproteobacteria bacterium]